MARTVRDAMTSEVRTATLTEPLTDAAQRMKADDVGSLPVVDGDRLVAILTDRDIVTRAVAEGVDVNGINVGDVASRELVTVEPDEALDEALTLMARHKVRRLPVVDAGRLVGMLAQADVALQGDGEEVAEVVAEISEPTGPAEPGGA